LSVERTLIDIIPTSRQTYTTNCSTCRYWKK